MRGEGRCKEVPDDGTAVEGSSHCVHPRRDGDLVCCWCGDLFLGEDCESGHHGKYKPRRRSPWR